VHEAPASKVLVLDHRGGYSGLGAAHQAMDKHMQKQGLQQGDIVLEEYITDPMAEPDSSKWLTRVVYYVK
jgi:effector-binding domain-containing protein